jgi:hypothetical protein
MAPDRDEWLQVRPAFGQEAQREIDLAWDDYS